MPTLKMQDHSDYEHMTTVNIAGIAGMVPGDRVYDTTLDRPMYYNNVSSAWERYIIVLNNQASFPGGNAAAPSITFDFDGDTGIYRIGANQVGIATSGFARFGVMDTYLVSYITGSAAVPSFVWSGDVDTGFFHPAADSVGFSTGGTERMRVGSGGIIFIGDGTTTTNANMTIGLTLQQGGADDEIVSLKSTDVAHGMTALTETNTFGMFKKGFAAAGGLYIQGFRDADGGPDGGLVLQGNLGENVDTTKTTAGRALVELIAAVKSGVNVGALNADGNAFGFRNHTTTIAIIDAEGTLHLDLGGNGVAATPSLTFGGDVDTGFYSGGANRIDVSSGGLLRMSIVSSGVRIPSSVYLMFGTSNEVIQYWDGTTWVWNIDGADSKWNDAPIAAFAAGNDLDAESTYWKFQDGGPDADSSGGNDGASFTYSAGDGSNAAILSAQNGGDGGHVVIESGIHGAGDGVGVDGSDGLVYIRRSDDSGFWEDLRVGMGLWIRLGVNDPTLSAWQPTGAGLTFRVYEFNNGDEVFFSVQIPHSYREGTDLKPHVHWTPRARGVAENGNTVFWRLDYTIANINGTFPAGATVNLHDTCDGVNEKHLVTGSGTISGVGVTISAELICRLYRAAGDTWAGAGAGNQPALLQFDIHYQTNTTGSRLENSK